MTAPSTSTLRRRILNRLMAAGTWVDREQLDTLTGVHIALEDELADLVLTRQVEYKRGAGYRMPGGPMVRLAMAELQARPELRRSIKGRRVGEATARRVVLGVAERRRLNGEPMDSIVAYLLELPPSDAAGAAQQIAALAAAMDQHPLPVDGPPGPQP